MSLFGLHELIEKKYDETNVLLEEILAVLKRIDAKMPEPQSATTPMSKPKPVAKKTVLRTYV